MLRALTGVIAKPFAAIEQNRKKNLQARSNAAAEKKAKLDLRRKAIGQAVELVRWIALESGWGKQDSDDGKYSAKQVISYRGSNLSLLCSARKEQDIRYGRNARAYVRANSREVLWVTNSETLVYEPGSWELLLHQWSWPSIYRVKLQCPVCDEVHEARVDKGRIWIDHFASGVMCPTCGVLSPPEAHGDQYIDALRKKDLIHEF